MKQNLAYVDAIRGLAIFMVIMIHCGVYGQSINSDILNKVVFSGKFGVQLFFLASAFTLFFSFSKRVNRESSHTLNFFIRRFFRIAPMYYLGVLYFSWQNLENVTTGMVVSNLFFVHGLYPDWIALVPGGWSISAEMIFYCIVPFLFKKLNSLDKTVSFLSITLIIDIVFQIILRTLIHLDGIDDFLYYSLPHQLPVLTCGIIIYFLLFKKDHYIEGNTICLLALSLLANTIYFSSFTPLLLFVVVFMLLFFGLSIYPSKVLVNPFFQFLGKISFSSYLVHFAVLHWLNEFGYINYFGGNGIGRVADYGIRLSIVIAITSVIAFIFYNTVEIRMQNVGKWLIAKKDVSKYKEEGLASIAINKATVQ